MKCKNGHKPPPGHRELEGEEREQHLAQMVKDGVMSRHVRRGPFTQKELKEASKMCLHLYVPK